MKPAKSEQQIADGVCDDDALLFKLRALPGYVNRWIPCEAVAIRMVETGEAELVVRRGGGFPDLPATDDTVHSS